MPLTEKQIRLASTIDEHVKETTGTGGTDEELLLSMSDYMDTFKRVMDLSTKDEMDTLCQRYDGFYHFAKLLEMLAAGIVDGSIEVPEQI